jgi:hypothetical protein
MPIFRLSPILIAFSMINEVQQRQGEYPKGLIIGIVKV